MPRETKEAEPRMGHQGICVKCRRLMPASSFAADITGQMGAWCGVCRAECAHKWSVDPDLVEWVRCMYVLEHNLKKEAETVMQARISMGQATPADLVSLRSQVDSHFRIQRSRIPARVRAVMQDYRESFYYALRMEVPDVVLDLPAATAAV